LKRLEPLEMEDLLLKLRENIGSCTYHTRTEGNTNFFSSKRLKNWAMLLDGIPTLPVFQKNPKKNLVSRYLPLYLGKHILT